LLRRGLEGGEGLGSTGTERTGSANPRLKKKRRDGKLLRGKESSEAGSKKTHEKTKRFRSRGSCSRQLTGEKGLDKEKKKKRVREQEDALKLGRREKGRS